MLVEGQDQNQDQSQAQEPIFTFTPVTSSDSENIDADVVSIPDEIPPVTPPETKPENTDKGEETPPVIPKEEEEETEEELEAVELNEEMAFNFLKDKKGLSFNSLEEFLESKAGKKIDPEIEKFLEYKEKTGRGYNDFLETQKDWSTEGEETLVKAALKIQNPSLSNEEIDFIFDRDYSFDPDLDDDFDIKSKKINLKVESKKALDLLNKQKEDYNVERGSNDDNVPEIYKEAKKLIDEIYDEQTENDRRATVKRENFISKTQTTLNDNFEGFKFNVEGQEFTVKPEDIKATLTTQLDISNFQQKFFDKDENLVDPVGYHRSLFAAMDPDKLAKHFFNLGKTSYAEQLEQDSKNIDVVGQRHIPNPELGTYTFKKA